MSILAPDRVLQTTTTVGTGPYALISATAAFRDFNAAYSNGKYAPYCATDNQFGFEIGIGLLTTGAPDTLSRSSILLSSNANSAVNWAGTTKQIFAWDVGGSAYAATFTGTQSVLAADWGSSFVFIGSSTGTFSLPTLSGIPRGYSVRLKNSGSAVCNVTPHSGDQIESYGPSTSYALYPGCALALASDLTVWRLPEFSTTLPVTLHRVASGSSDTLSALVAVRTQITWESNSGAGKSQSIPAASGYDGHEIDVFDYFGDSTANPITITPAAGTITVASLGSVSNLTLQSAYGNISFRAIAALNTWIVT